MQDTPEYSLITESFNLAEGQSFDSLCASIAALRAIATRHSAEMLISDSSGDPRVLALASTDGIPLRVLDATAMSYDEQKNLGAEAARGRWLVYLDGDCRPLRDDWIDCITAPLRAGMAAAVGGVTLYDDFTPTGIAATLMDFGYVWDRNGGSLGCYSSNNVAFARNLRCEIPIVPGAMRCNCYAHAQTLVQAGHRLHAALDAIVLHEMPDVASERYRRGHDLIAACWSNPLQIEASRLYATAPALEWQLRRLQHLDALRLHTAPAAVGITASNRDAVVQSLVRLRGIEAIGIRDALLAGEQDGRNHEARQACLQWQRARAGEMQPV